MLNSLRGNLLLAFSAVIVAMFLVITVALLAISATQNMRLVPTLQQLSVIGQSVRREWLSQQQEEFSTRELERFLDENAAAHSVRIIVVSRENGLVVYDSAPGSGAWRFLRLAAITAPRLQIPNQDSNLPFGRYREVNGQRWLLFSQTFPLRRAGQFLILYGRPEPTALNYFRETFLRPLCQAGILALIFSVLLAYLIARSVSRPLQRMADASEAIAQGEYNQQLPIRGPDEIRRVAGSFNTMASQVSATQQAQRDFVANVSHDLKTPLTSIRGWSQALLDGTASTEEQRRQAVKVIYNESERMDRMVGQLLELARVDSGQLVLSCERLDLADVLAELHDTFTMRTREAGIELSLDCQPVPLISGDHDRLVQLLNNLVDNALLYTPGGGRVVIKLYASDGGAVIEVTDTGPGIPPDEIPRIFQRFYQVERSRAQSAKSQGAGLGLAIVKELVEAHKGQVSVRSREGEGTTFTVFLPAPALPA